MLSPETKKTPGKLGSPSHLSYMVCTEQQWEQTSPYISLQSQVICTLSLADKTPREPLEAYIWVDASSFEEHIDILEGVLHNLQRLIEEVSRDYYWVRFCMHFSRGIAETYHRSLRKCEEENWCSYLMFVEDDWMFEYTNIKHSAMELLALCQGHDWINYIRFNKRITTGILFDSPCVVQDTRGPIPLTHTAGFSNNAHLCRVSAVQKLFDITHGRQPTPGVLSAIRTSARWACSPCATILSMPVLPTFRLCKTLQSVITKSMYKIMAVQIQTGQLRHSSKSVQLLVRMTRAGLPGTIIVVSIFMENSRDLKLHRIYKAMAGSLIQHCSGLVHLQL